MGRLEKYLRPYWGYILLTVSIKFVATVFELLIPNLMQSIIDEKVPAGILSEIYLYGGCMLLCAVLSLAGNVLANRMSAVSAGKVTRTLRHDLFQKLELLSARQMDTLTVSSAVSRLTSDSYNVNQMLARIQRMGIRAPILLIGGIVMMLRMDTVLALVLIALLPFICVVVYLVTKRTVPLYTSVQSILDRVVQVCQENITGIRIIKALSKTEYERGRFDGVNDELSDTNMKAGTINNLTRPIVNFILYLGLTLVVVVGAYRVDAGACKSGVIVAFLQYFTMILNAMLGITRIFIMWSKGQASANRIADVMELPQDPQLLPPADSSDDPAHIEFRDVSFSYTSIGKDLDSLSFCLEHGQILGILGPTGSGKSTVINLLLRMYDADSGQILIDGQDIRTVPPETLRKKFGVVFQNDFITEGTIRDNIRFFRQLPDAALEQAASDAQASFIQEKEGAMDAQVMVRGNNLSGGQKQRLLIARALAANPEILILDDASSALDYQTDAQLRRALRQNYGSTTTVLVAQRVSSLRHADLILMLEDGRVIGSGTHSQLIEHCEEYRAIAVAQMGDRKEGA